MEDKKLGSEIIVAVGSMHNIPERDTPLEGFRVATPGLSDILGRNVRREREKAGLSQLQLAQRAQINPEGLADVENGRGNPRIGKIIRIATALNMRTGELLAQPGEYQPSPHGVPDPTEALAHGLRKGRTKLVLTQEQFAKQSHVSVQKIIAIEDRDGDPTLDEMIRMALIIGIKPWQLLAPWIHYL
jgi:transcriptional regulator with XRE-family HTH domain